MTVYRVLIAEFDGYAPGSTFEAVLDPAKERRALRRGNIEILDETPPVLVPGSYKLQDPPWLTK